MGTAGFAAHVLRSNSLGSNMQKKEMMTAATGVFHLACLLSLSEPQDCLPARRIFLAENKQWHTDHASFGTSHGVLP